MRFNVCSDHKQWGQSPSIEKTRAYRRHDLDLHTKISIWEIIRFEPGWVPKHEINDRLISAVIFFCQFATLLRTPKSSQFFFLANLRLCFGCRNRRNWRIRQGQCPCPGKAQCICDPFDAYDIVAHWKRIAQFFVEK